MPREKDDPVETAIGTQELMCNGEFFQRDSPERIRSTEALLSIENLQPS
jgi:hypothetical protein